MLVNCKCMKSHKHAKEYILNSNKELIANQMGTLPF